MDGAVWRLRTNAVRFELNDEKQERFKLDDESLAPKIPKNTPEGLNGDFDTFLFYPHRLHTRQINQLAAYTVHPNPNPNLKNPSDFSQTLRREESLVRYIIPKEIQQKVFAKLWSLGIRYESLFPDPEGAAKGAKYAVETEDGSLWTSD